MASSFPSISQALAYFESPDPAKLAAEEKARQDALAERLRISAFSGPPNVSSPPHEAATSQASRPEVPPRPVRKRGARDNPPILDTMLPLTPQDSTITVSSRHRDPPTSEAEVTALRNEISGIKVEVEGLKEQLGIRNEEFEVLNKRLRDTERRYEEAIVDMRRSREEKQELEDMVGRLRRELDGTRNARDVAQAQLATRQRELVDALETWRVSEERRSEEARRVEARVRAQQPLSSEYGHSPYDAPQPVTSSYGYSSTDALQPVTSSYGYSSTDAPQPMASSEYNPDTSHAQIYDPLDAPTYSTPPYSSENVSPESHENVDSNIRGHRRTRQSRGHTDNSKARKTRKRY